VEQYASEKQQITNRVKYHFTDSHARLFHLYDVVHSVPLAPAFLHHFLLDIANYRGINRNRNFVYHDIFNQIYKPICRLIEHHRRVCIYVRDIFVFSAAYNA
jgi:hypothetical protein